MITRPADIVAAAERLAPAVIEIRRDLHAHPELGFNEHRTADLVARRLESLGIEARRGVGGTGVVATISGSSPGRTLLLRADMDALPLEERSSAPYASATPGVMHACGHDGHTAILLGVAEILSVARLEFAGSVRLMFQPAEEQPPGGALAMIEQGVLEGVDAAMGLHLWNPLPTGLVAVSAGTVMAAHDRLRVRIAGRGGHGAMPESTQDPVVAMAQLITELQTVVSRSVAPLESAVVTIGRVAAGSAFNVIPDSAEAEGSIRSLGIEVRDRVHERIRSIAAGRAMASNVRIDVEIEEFVPSLDNDQDLTAKVESAVVRALGREPIRTKFRTMAGEDFAFIARLVPSCFLFVGSGSPDGHSAPHHHPSFDIDESSLRHGMVALAAASAGYLRAK